MKKTIQKMRRVLANVVRQYRPDPRNLRCYDPEEGQCVYNMSVPHGQVKGGMTHCAVGMHMTPEIRDQGEDWTGNGESLWDLAYPNCYRDGIDEDNNPSVALDSLLEPDYRGLPFLFWSRLQEFHDDPCHWQSRGALKEKAGLIKQEFAL